MKPETKLMRAIFGIELDDDACHESVDGVSLRAALDNALGTLSLLDPIGYPSFVARAETTIKMRFGLDDGRSKTLREIGVYYDRTQERIRQTESKALRILRHPSRSDTLKRYLK